MICPRMICSLLMVILLSQSLPAQSPARVKIEKKILTLEKNIRKKESELDRLYRQLGDAGSLLLAVSPEDVELAREFLKQKETGLIRLIPKERYEKDFRTMVKSGAASFSFSQQKYRYYPRDIELRKGVFETASLPVRSGEVQFGFIASLGDVDLESLSNRNPCAQFLASILPASNRRDIQEWRSRIWLGPPGCICSPSAPAKENCTYVLRSVHYPLSDVLVALRAVREDDDGSYIIWWKLLETFPPPELDYGMTVTSGPDPEP